MTGAEMIAAERQRQIEAEGWTPEHDDEHEAAEILRAATSYIDTAYAQAMRRPPRTRAPMGWPWSECWWKPSDDPIRNLVKGGALIAAEIDRLKRLLGRAESVMAIQAFQQITGKRQVVCRPLKANIPEAPAGAQLTACPVCGCDCWRMPLEPVPLPADCTAACTSCALKAGANA